ncbi:hypothetical protein V5F53_02260 [Xanthobacter sp. V4C-4]|uniref:hypothetical protein n=1 Tax=Xanthobacter cornucopiae TaxID=3119924 RepID=UPI0037288A01
MSEAQRAEPSKDSPDHRSPSERDRRILAYLAAITALLAAVAGVLQWIVPLLGGGAPPPAPQFNITNTVTVPGVVAVSPGAIPMAEAPPAPASASVAAPVAGPAVVPDASARRPPLPSERTRNVAVGQAFPLCGVEAFELTPWRPMAGRPRQATLRAPAPVPGRPGSGVFEQVLTLGVAQELWPGCQVTLTVVGDEGPVAAISLRERFSGHSGQ